MLISAGPKTILFTKLNSLVRMREGRVGQYGTFKFILGWKKQIIS